MTGSAGGPGTSGATLVEAMAAAWAALARAGDGTVAPVAILWTDPSSEWAAMWPTVLASGTSALRLGTYEPATHTGPAIWIRAALAGALPDVPVGPCPVVYLPGVARDRLRAGPECPAEWQPLVELLFRGTTWHHRTNYDDWTVAGYLGSGAEYGGLGLDVARDQATRAAAVRAVATLATAPLDRLQGKRLEASDFDTLHLPDPVVSLLEWLERGDAVRTASSPEAWGALRSLARAQFGVDPDTADPAVVARSLTDPSSRLDPVWHRFADAPGKYPRVVDHLRALGPAAAGLFTDEKRFPAANDVDEAAVRSALASLPAHAPASARDSVKALEAAHARRRDWTWAALGQAPMARALEPLARLAAATAAGPVATDATGIASWYAGTGWHADAAALQALRHATGADAALLRTVVRTLYLPWLEQVSGAFQAAAGPNPAATLAPSGTTAPEAGECLVFVDGLRFDVAAALRDALASDDLAVAVSHRVAPYPSVTGTAKPFAAGVADALDRSSARAEDFEPRVLATGQAATGDRLRALLGEAGVTVLTEVGGPLSPEARGWLEVGTIDKRGHDGGLDLVVHLDDEVDEAARVVAGLLAAGWRRVRVVTDHGWLLVPGSLPYRPLPKAVAADQWARAALPDEGAAPDAPLRAWHWNPLVSVASPPGVSSFRPNVAYAHGGLSPQESVVPELVVTASGGGPRVAIREVTWNRLSCRVTVETGGQSVRVALRTVWRDPASTIGGPSQPVGASGSIRVPVSDEHEGKAVAVVAIDGAGTVVARASTNVGGA